MGPEQVTRPKTLQGLMMMVMMMIMMTDSLLVPLLYHF